MSILIDVLSWLALLAGGFFVVTGGVGLLRFPDFFTRIHAAGVTDTAGASLILLGLMLQGGLTMVTVKLVLILWFLLFTGPVATHALAKAALHGRLEPLVVGDGEAPAASSPTSSSPPGGGESSRETEREGKPPPSSPTQSQAGSSSPASTQEEDEPSPPSSTS